MVSLASLPYYPHATRKQGRAFVIDGSPPFTVKCLSAVPFCPKDVFNDPSDLGDSLPNHQIDAPVNDVVSLTSDVTADRQVYFSLNAFVNLSAHRNNKEDNSDEKLGIAQAYYRPQ